MSEQFEPGTADYFFWWRDDWLRVDVMRNKHGAWAVALVLDEGYAQDDAQRMAEFFADEVEKVRVNVRAKDTDRAIVRGLFRPDADGAA